MTPPEMAEKSSVSPASANISSTPLSSAKKKVLALALPRSTSLNLLPWMFSILTRVVTGPPAIRLASPVERSMDMPPVAISKLTVSPGPFLPDTKSVDSPPPST